MKFKLDLSTTMYRLEVNFRLKLTTAWSITNLHLARELFGHPYYSEIKIDQPTSQTDLLAASYTKLIANN